MHFTTRLGIAGIIIDALATVYIHHSVTAIVLASIIGAIFIFWVRQHIVHPEPRTRKRA